MPGVDEIGKIRRAHFREGRLINGISSGLAVSRRRFGRLCVMARRHSRLSARGSRVGRSALQPALYGIFAGNAVRPKHECLMIIRIFEDLRGRCYEGFVANDLQGGAPDRITDHILIETFHQHTQMVADGLFSTCSASRIASSSSTGPRFRRSPAKWPMTTASSDRQAARAVEFTIPHPAALPLHRDKGDNAGCLVPDGQSSDRRSHTVTAISFFANQLA